MKVLIVEDDQNIIDNISFCLEVGYKDVTLVSVCNEPRALEIAQTESPDLVMMDVSLTSLDILGLIRKMRECSDVPIFILGEAETDLDRARGLEAGADEYISKPFSPIELLARCRALLRRCRQSVIATAYPVSIDGLSINFMTREVLLTGQPLKLTPTEYGLLSELVRNTGRVVTNRDLLIKVWGAEYIGDPNLIKTYIYRLRSKLEPVNGASPKILSERGIGYRLV
jgi:two-component system KDP operon response regulator KdpE